MTVIYKKLSPWYQETMLSRISDYENPLDGAWQYKYIFYLVYERQ
jgi:hypothetical protein